MEDGRTPLSDSVSEASSDREREQRVREQREQRERDDRKPSPSSEHFPVLSREALLHGNGLHHVREHEALQVKKDLKTREKGRAGIIYIARCTEVMISAQ